MTVLGARRRAEGLAERLGPDQAPVDVERIAKQLGIRVVRTRFGDGISGLLIRKAAEVTICVEISHHPNRQRFTISHEIGHHYLGHQFEPGEHVHVDRETLVSKRNDRSSAGTDLKEVEANQFAACLLMPRRLIEREVTARGTALTDTDVTELANTFEVSEQAMTIRLTVLGWL